MNVLIVGIGTFGLALLRELKNENAKVYVVDKNRELVEGISKEDHISYIADARVPESWAAIPLTEIDFAVCCIGDDMEASLLTCLHLRNNGVNKIIARASSEYHKVLLNAINVEDVIMPEEDAGRRIGQKILNKHVYNYIPLSDNHLIAEVRPSRWMLGIQLKELRLREEYSVNVIAIKEFIKDIDSNGDNIFKERIIDIPEPTYIVRENSVLIVVGTDTAIENLKAVV